MLTNKTAINSMDASNRLATSSIIQKENWLLVGSSDECTSAHPASAGTAGNPNSPVSVTLHADFTEKIFCFFQKYMRSELSGWTKEETQFAL